MTEVLSLRYRHRAKNAVSSPPFRLGATVVKWYDLDESANRISAETRMSAQQALQAFGETLASDVAAFAILHQCTAAFCFLLISTWRGNNELWQSVLYRDQPMTEFAAFEPAYSQSAPSPRPTFCVWELGIVAHEAQAWQRYLSSGRTISDFAAWQSDCLTAPV